MKYSLLLVVTYFFHSSGLEYFVLENGNVTLKANVTANDGIFLTLLRNNITRFSGHIGVGVPFESDASPPASETQDNQVKFLISTAVDGFNIFWESKNTSQVFQDCFDLQDFVWFSGKEGNTSQWPIQKSVIATSANIVSSGSSVSESYWLSSGGTFIFVNETVPLFVDQNHLEANSLCLVAQLKEPYAERSRVLLNYTIAASDDAKAAQRNAIDNFLGRPTGQPDMKMVREPVWSTWGKYGDDIDDSSLQDFAESIWANKFRGQVQIESGWEECYGSLTFKQHQFAAINTTIIDAKNLALRVTLWVHPFVDVNCESTAQTGLDNGYFAKGSDGKEIVTAWAKSNSSYLIDFTNAEARTWFQERVGLLIEKHRLDGFKFDDGEASWATSDAVLGGDPEWQPNQITAMYNSISNFTTYVDVHSGWRTQWLPVFVTMPEKEPNWSEEDGLKSVLINLFQLNLAGYTMVVPGLIGGKSPVRPSPELYVRWTQAVTFMPVMQFGYLPWEISRTSFDVLAIVQKFVNLHSWFSDGIMNILRKSEFMGLPVNSPIWWVDPTNPRAFEIFDQYMLGENIMIAPVLDEGVVVRDIYLPPGRWRDGNNDPVIYNGSTTLENYPAPIDVLPYFTREN